MNDRFKFRAWDKINNEWIKIPHLSLDVKTGMLNGFFDYTEAAKRRYTLEQCTGLKDKNGKLIYEGDIVEIMVWDDIEEDWIETKGKVYWSKEDAAFLIFVSYDGEYSLNSQETFYGQEIKVIGNIHENTDLLEVGGK